MMWERPAHHTDSSISCRFSIRSMSHSSAAMRDAIELQLVPALEGIFSCSWLSLLRERDELCHLLGGVLEHIDTIVECT